MHVLLLNDLSIGLDLVSLRELSSGRAHSRHFNAFEEGVAGAIRIDSRKLHLLLIVAKEDLHVVGPSPVGNGEIQLLHEQLDDFVDSLVNNEVGSIINLGPLEVDHDEPASIGDAT